MSELATMLDFALDLADRAGRTTLGHFRTGTRPDWKEDATPVTVADLEAETLVRHAIEKRYPDHAVIGEEHGTTSGTSPWRWWIDPIDGTKAFVRGVPLYGVLIGLERDGEIVAGVASFPALGETIAAAQGLGCRLNGRACHVSEEGDLARAVVSTTDPAMFDRLGRGGPWRRVCDAFWVRAGWGDAYGYALVASGRIEAMLDPVMNAWDAGPFPVILAEAGGFFGDWRGNVTIHGGEGVGVNAELKAPLLAMLAADGDATDATARDEGGEGGGDGAASGDGAQATDS